MQKPGFEARLRPLLRELWKDIYTSVWLIFRILIPVSIIVKILKELGIIEWIGQLLSPLMQGVGLPGEMGLVWATGMITNLFGGIMAFLQVSEGMNLSVAQVTVISVMMLVAHTFPIELQIARKAGVRIWFSFLLRFVGAYILGLIINLLYSTLGLFQDVAQVVWRPEVSRENSLWDWALSELKTYAIILVFIVSLIVLVKILRELGVIRLIARFLSPLLRRLGIGESVTTLTMVGLTLGIVYGGALIINETRTAKLNPRDIFFSMALMGLCHSLIEDTILVVSLGADIWGVLVLRLAFALLIIALMVRAFRRIKDPAFMRYLMVSSPKIPENQPDE